MTKMSYDEAVSFIHGRRKFTKDPSLVKMRRMAELMGNPQKKLKLIHVTGTNGKGSVTAYLRELLMSHGYRVGTFTSPFIVRFNERVAIDGEMIPDNELVEEVERIKPVIERIDDEFDNDGPKEFEVLSIEIGNKKIESDYSFLSKIQSDEVKIQLEEKIIKDIKKDIITEEIKIEATKSFEDSLRKLANSLKVNVRFY